ncbi:MAG: multidrug effflux MFS transporter [Geminicoccaceae bacterium]
MSAPAVDTTAARRTPSATKRGPGLSLLLVALVSLGPVSTDLYLPSLPAIGADLSASADMVQLTVGLFIAGFAVMMLFCGPLGDRFGRRPVLLGGLGIFFIGSLACALAPTIHWLLAARFLQAIGACVGPVLGRAIVRDLYPPDMAARVLSYMAGAMALAPLVAPFLGGWLVVHFDWRACFYALALIALLVGVALYVRLGETSPGQVHDALRPARLLHHYRALLADRVYLGYAICVALSFGALFTWISNASIVIMDNFGVRADHFARYFGVVVLGYVVGAFTIGRFGHHLGIWRAMKTGGLLALVGAVTLNLALLFDSASLPLIIAAMAMAFFGFAFVLPQATAGGLAEYPHKAGMAAALMGFLQMSTGFTINALSSLLYDGSPWPMAVLLALSVSGMLVATFTLVRPRDASVRPKQAE